MHACTRRDRQRGTTRRNACLHAAPRRLLRQACQRLVAFRSFARPSPFMVCVRCAGGSSSGAGLNGAAAPQASESGGSSTASMDGSAGGAGALATVSDFNLRAVAALLDKELQQVRMDGWIRGRERRSGALRLAEHCCRAARLHHFHTYTVSRRLCHRAGSAAMPGGRSCSSCHKHGHTWHLGKSHPIHPPPPPGLWQASA